MSQQEHQMSATDIRKSVRDLVTLRGSANITIATQDSKFRQEAYKHTLNYLSDWADYHPNGFKEWYVENIDMLRHTEGFARPEGSLTSHKGIIGIVFLRSKDGFGFTKTTYVFILDLDSSCRFRRVEQRIIRETKFHMDELDKMLEDSKSRRIYQSF
ncbi:hypothetical protein GQ607_002220 [Colletotrichum asianum]|uniref:Uncharacterized protein n=1 Tax=Colletotrichum asianum TaxID=702518 RepID=A0A8H3ZWP2_9PEZI|nr:hypothetical protein GQ607_002220 [Colletotrichum asianum]